MLGSLPPKKLGARPASVDALDLRLGHASYRPCPQKGRLSLAARRAPVNGHIIFTWHDRHVLFHQAYFQRIGAYQ